MGRAPIAILYLSILGLCVCTTVIIAVVTQKRRRQSQASIRARARAAHLRVQASATPCLPPNILEPFRPDVDRATIFISLPSFRDSETPHTILSALRRASNPSRVFIGLCQQNAPQDPHEVEQAIRLAKDASGDVDWIRGHVRELRMDARHAKGPILARWRIERELYKGEDFVLMIDSHTQFAPGWDSMCVREWKDADRVASTPSLAVLTTYPESYHREDRDGADFDQTVTKLTFKGVEGGPQGGMVLWDTTDLTPQEVEAPVPPRSIGWSANYSFMPRTVVRLVPFHDGRVYPRLFFGEEVGMAARLFTSGVDLFCPRKHAILTTYEREYRPLYWDEDEAQVREAQEEEMGAQSIMREMLGMKPFHKPQGSASNRGRALRACGFLGSARSLRDYERYSGIDIMRGKGTAAAKRGEVQMD